MPDDERLPIDHVLPGRAASAGSRLDTASGVRPRRQAMGRRL